MNWLQQRKLRRQEPDHNPNTCLVCNTRTSSLLTYRAIWVLLRGTVISERDIGVRDIGVRDIGVRDIGVRDIGVRDIEETVATCLSAEQLLIHIHIRGVSGCLSFSQSWHFQGRFLRHHKSQMFQPTEGMSLWSSWSWATLRGLCLWGRRRRLRTWGMLAHLLALVR